MVLLGRGVGDHGESACKVGIEDCFQRGMKEAARAVQGGGPLRSSMNMSICC
jgi:hypothetical protein